MIDLHMHTFLSDGVLIPSELVRRAVVKGYTAMAITDHGDLSNLDFIIPRLKKVCADLSKRWPIVAVPGVEITHVPLESIEKLVKAARRLGAKVVLVHGETTVEPVLPGTNRAAILSGADIVVHPGTIAEADVQLAAAKGVYLEITSRRGHNLTNDHVGRLAKKLGAKLVFDTDSHGPGDLKTDEEAMGIVMAAGMEKKDFEIIQANSRGLLKRRGVNL